MQSWAKGWEQGCHSQPTRSGDLNAPLGGVWKRLVWIYLGRRSRVAINSYCCLIGVRALYACKVPRIPQMSPPFWSHCLKAELDGPSPMPLSAFCSCRCWGPISLQCLWWHLSLCKAVTSLHGTHSTQSINKSINLCGTDLVLDKNHMGEHWCCLRTLLSSGNTLISAHLLFRFFLPGILFRACSSAQWHTLIL